MAALAGPGWPHTRDGARGSARRPARVGCVERGEGYFERERELCVMGVLHSGARPTWALGVSVSGVVRASTTYLTRSQDGAGRMPVTCVYHPGHARG